MTIFFSLATPIGITSFGHMLQHLITINFLFGAYHVNNFKIILLAQRVERVSDVVRVCVCMIEIIEENMGSRQTCAGKRDST